MILVLLLQENCNISCRVVLLAINSWFWFENVLHLFFKNILLVVMWDFCVYCCFIVCQLEERNGSNFLSLVWKGTCFYSLAVFKNFYLPFAFSSSNVHVCVCARVHWTHISYLVIVSSHRPLFLLFSFWNSTFRPVTLHDKVLQLSDHV